MLRCWPPQTTDDLNGTDTTMVAVLLSLSLFLFSFMFFCHDPKAPPFHCLCFRLAWVWGFWLVRKKVGLGVTVGRSVGLGFCLV